MPKLITLEHEDTGKTITVSSKAGTDLTIGQAEELADAWLQGLNEDGVTSNFPIPEQFQIFDVTPQRPVGERVSRAIGRTTNRLRRGALDFIKTDEGRIVARSLFGSERAAKFLIENAPLPEGTGDVAADVGFTLAALIPGTGTAATVGRIALPSVMNFLGEIAGGRTVEQASARAQLTAIAGGIPEFGRGIATFSKNLAGTRSLQKQDVRNVTRGLQDILPEGAPQLPTNVAELSKVIDTELPEFATKQFQRRLDIINQLAGDSKIIVPSIDDVNPVSVGEAIAVITGKRFRLNQNILRGRTGPQKLAAAEREQLIEEFTQGLTEAAPRNPQLARIEPIYRAANQERRDIGDVQRLFQGVPGQDSPFNLDTGRLDMNKLQQRVLALRQPNIRGISPKNIDAIENVASRGTGTFSTVDRPFKFDPAFFTRGGGEGGTPIGLPGVGGLRPSLIDLPRFVGRPKFARRVAPEVSAVTSITTGQRLRNSPFGVQE